MPNQNFSKVKSAETAQLTWLSRLLIEEHSCEQGERIIGQQRVGLRISGEVHRTHRSIIARIRRSIIPRYHHQMLCPCSGKPPGADFDQCCRPALDGEIWPTTAEALMRSRYTAFVRGDEDHLFRTWHARTRPADVGVDSETTWLGLEILGTAAGGPDDATGTVHFRARYRDHLGEHVLEENSAFVRRAGRWMYLEALEN